MSLTRFGLLLRAVGWGCFPVALALGTPAPAFLGAALLCAVHGRRREEADYTLTRELPERVVAGEPFRVVTRVTASAPIPVFAREEVPLGVRVVSEGTLAVRGACTVTLECVAQTPGIMLWDQVHVREQDGWGTSEESFTLSEPAVCEVTLESDAVLAGRKAGQSVEIEARIRHARGFEIEPEIERLRSYQPGDRLRDIAWAQVAKLGQLISREWSRQSNLPVIILLDAGRSMRWQRRHNKLATSARTGIGLLAAAQTSGASVGLVAWSEEGVEAQIRPTASRRAVSEALLRLSGLPAPVAAAPRALAPDASALRKLSAGEREFLLASGAFFPRFRGAATPLEEALGALTRVATQPCLVVAFLDAEETPAAVGAIVGRLRRHQHRVVVVAPASGAHHYARADLDDDALARLVEWRRNREAAEAAARRHGARFVVLGPHVDDHSLREVLRSVAS